MRGTAGDAARRTTAATALMTAGLLASGTALAACGSSASSKPKAAAPSATPTQATPADRIADCATKVDYWIQNYLFKGIPDHGDYQELGLSSSEGLALRQLEQALTAAKQTTAATAPSDLKQQEKTYCTNAGAATPGDPNNPIGWP